MRIPLPGQQAASGMNPQPHGAQSAQLSGNPGEGSAALWCIRVPQLAQPVRLQIGLVGIRTWHRVHSKTAALIISFRKQWKEGKF
jgi:hypothetical protein